MNVHSLAVPDMSPGPEICAAISEMLVALNGILDGFARRDVGIRLCEAPDGSYGAILCSPEGEKFVFFSPPTPVNDL